MRPKSKQKITSLSGLIAPWAVTVHTGQWEISATALLPPGAMTGVKVIDNNISTLTISFDYIF